MALIFSYIYIYIYRGKQWQTTPQELAQDAVGHSHTGHMTGLWFLPARPLRLNTNAIYIYIHLKIATITIYEAY